MPNPTRGGGGGGGGGGGKHSRVLLVADCSTLHYSWQSAALTRGLLRLALSLGPRGGVELALRVFDNGLAPCDAGELGWALVRRSFQVRAYIVLDFGLWTGWTG